MSELLAEGDPAPLPHLLPPIPTEPREVPVFEGQQQVGTRPEPWPLENAVAQCARCGWLFVSREDPDGWGRVVRWVRLRWWHRKAWAKLREAAKPCYDADGYCLTHHTSECFEKARRIGGVAP